MNGCGNKSFPEYVKVSQVLMYLPLFFVCLATILFVSFSSNICASFLREWYSCHFPELVKIVPENYTYTKLVRFIGNRKQLSVESIPGLEEITMDSGKAEAILAASKSSIGMDINEIDLIHIEMFGTRITALADYKKRLVEYLKTKMYEIAPNLTTLIGEQVGARLISHAGSLINLAKYPASTVQVLDAEKALFRALKRRGIFSLTVFLMFL